MPTCFISRHPSAIAWAEQQCAKVNERITHLDIDLIKLGGTVIGSLPVNLAAQVCGKGATYILLAPPIAYLLGLENAGYTARIYIGLYIEAVMTLQVIKKWGNSPALRIPNAVMQAVQLKLDQTVDMRVENGKIIIEPQPDNYRLEDLLAGITEENRHAEIDFGSAQGRENL